jgi:PAS domain S-box-containing protein
MMGERKIKNNSPAYIVAVGGSAGGREALDSVLAHLPAGMENIAWVIAQNGHPLVKKQAAGRLGGHHKLTVVEMAEPIAVRGNHLYFPPAGREILFKNGKLQLSKSVRYAGTDHSIDRLFTSIARAKKTQAVGIVLSGTGPDGALGIRAIRKNGGTTFVQDPVSAIYKTKPRISVKTGNADYILDTEKMGRQLKKIICPASSAHQLKKRKGAITPDPLLKSPDLIEALFQTPGMGMALLDEKGIYLKTNRCYNQLLGYEAGELEGKGYMVTVPPGFKADSLRKLVNEFTGEDAVEKRPAVKKNGELFFVFKTAKIIRNPDGTKNILVTIRDVSESIKYRHLLIHTEKDTPIGNWELDISINRIHRSEEMYRILEMNQAELDKLGFEKKMETLFEPASRLEIRKAMKAAVHQGKPFDLELALITGNVKRKWVRITCTAEFVKTKPVKLYGTMRDITVQKETELQLERLSLVASKTNNAVFITDENEKTVWINDSVEKMTGYRRRELIGKKPGEVLMGTDTDQKILHRISKRLKKRLPVSEVLKNYKKDGSAFWINIDIAPVIKDNKLENFIGIGADITELILAREAEKIKNALEHRQKLFNAIAQNFPDGIIGVLDSKLHYVFAGGSEIKRLGLTLDQIIGNNIFDHISEKSNADAVPYLNRAKAGIPVSFEAEMKDNTYAVSAVPLFGDDEINKQILVVLYNITKRKKAEEEVKEALFQQKELNELKSKFVSIASHEFRTPLSTILSSTFLISKYNQLQESGKELKHIDRIESAVRILTDILNDFLSLGRIEDGKVENHPVQFNVSEFCHSLTDEVQPSLKKGQTVIYLHEKGNDNFSLDKRLLRNVLINLLSNATKYSSEGQNIWLISSCPNGHMQFTIQDEGIGIPAGDQPHLFQTFFRANNALHIQGTGMGLHIVKRFLEIMGGKIHFTSMENKGSSFTIRFPLSPVGDTDRLQ